MRLASALKALLDNSRLDLPTSRLVETDQSCPEVPKSKPAKPKRRNSNIELQPPQQHIMTGDLVIFKA